MHFAEGVHWYQPLAEAAGNKCVPRLYAKKNIRFAQISKSSIMEDKKWKQRREKLADEKQKML